MFNFLRIQKTPPCATIFMIYDKKIMFKLMKIYKCQRIDSIYEDYLYFIRIENCKIYKI